MTSINGVTVTDYLEGGEHSDFPPLRFIPLPRIAAAIQIATYIPGKQPPTQAKITKHIKLPCTGGIMVIREYDRSVAASIARTRMLS